MNNPRTISVVAQEFGLDEDQLRYWDRLGILSPQRVGAVRVYSDLDLQKLSRIKVLMAEGFRPSEIRLMLLATSWVSKRSESQVDALSQLMSTARVGDTVEEPFGVNTYNTVYQRVSRMAKKHGKKVIIKTTQDRKALGAKVIG